MTWKSTVYRRQDLYDQVWAEPMTTVATRYGVSSVALAKTCRRLAIPVPGRGYWVRVRAGQPLKRPPLRRAPPGVPEALELQHVVAEVRGHAVDARVERERDPALRISVAPELEDPHPLVRAAKRLLSKSKPDREGLLCVHDERCLRIQVSGAALDRALRVMNALIRACEERQLPFEVTPLVPHSERTYESRQFSNVTRIQVEGVWIRLRLRERWSIVPKTEKPSPDLTAAELRRWDWEHRPDRVPSGNLELHLAADIGEALFVDRGKRRMEDMLNDAIVRMHELAADVRRWRFERDAARERAEAEAIERRREEARVAEEKRRLAVMTESVQAWRLSRDIREYVAEALTLAARAGLDSTTSPNLMATLAWAKEYADQSDPMRDLREAASRSS